MSISVSVCVWPISQFVIVVNSSFLLYVRVRLFVDFLVENDYAYAYSWLAGRLAVCMCDDI